MTGNMTGGKFGKYMKWEKFMSLWCERVWKIWKMNFGLLELFGIIWGETDGEVEVRGYAAAYGGNSFEVS